MFKFLVLLAAICGSLRAGCVAIESDQILGKDLAKADSAFASLNPDLYFSYAPVIGKQRTITASELTNWAAAHAIQYVAHGPLCFERTAYNLTAEDAATAIRQAFGAEAPQLQIDVLELCKCIVPAGKLEFSRKSVMPPPVGHPETPILWRGQLITKSGMSYPVWARVRVLTTIRLVRAKQNIRSQQIIAPNEIEEVSATESPLRFTQPQSSAMYAGKLATRSILDGAYLDPESVREPSAVTRGNVVKVDVINGPTHLQLDARAETAGNTGDRITLTNPAGMKRFQATVTGPGHAEIVLFPDGDTANSAENKDTLAATTSKRIL